MLVEDEYGNPILCFHGGSWFVKRKMAIVDLRTGQNCGRMEEELKALSGKYKFKTFLDEKDEPFGTTMKLGKFESQHFTSAELIVKTLTHGKTSAITPLDVSPTEFKYGDQFALSYLHSSIHQPAVQGDVYFVEVGAGLDIRFMLSVVVAYDKFVTAN
jgi:hypothetical protein